ncbi:MAG: hypothetical protein JXB38_05820 [Anaerolineales bacterium]|nr:hypothetical protein [Anaerolineales bacterium]
MPKPSPKTPPVFRLYVPRVLSIICTVSLLTIGTLKSVGLLTLAPIPLLVVTFLGLGVLIGGVYARSRKWAPDASGVMRHIPSTVTGFVPIGALLGLLIGGLVALFLSGRQATATPLGTSISENELIGMLIGMLIGVIFAIVVHPRLAAGLLFGFGLGYPTALLIVAPQVHDLYWTYGGYLATFGVLGAVHFWLTPLLTRTHQTREEA